MGVWLGSRVVSKDCETDCSSWAASSILGELESRASCWLGFEEGEEEGATCKAHQASAHMKKKRRRASAKHGRHLHG